MSDDCFGDTAQQKGVFTVATAGPHRDDVGVIVLGVLHDFRRGVAFADGGDELAVGHLVRGAGLDGGDGFTAGGSERILEVITQFVGRGSDVTGIDHRESVDSRLEAVGDVEGHPDGTLCALGPVRGDDDCLEHIYGYHGRGQKAARFRARPAAFCRCPEDTPTMGVELDLVLAPVDTSDESERAVDYAVAIADRYDANLHLLHVLDQRVARGIETGDVTAESVAEEHRAFTGRVRERLADDIELSNTSAAGFSAQRLSQTPGSVILDAAEELDADFLVIPRETDPDGLEATLGKAALYVLEYASQPVLSV